MDSDRESRLPTDGEGGEAGEASTGRTTPRPGRAIVGWLALLLVVGVVWILQGAGGQRLVLGAALSRIERGLTGELTIEGIRSGSLLFGATLTGVRLDAEGGHPFLQADSVRVRYSLLSLALGRPRVGALTLWSPRLEISTYAGEDAPNVMRLLPERPRPDSSAVAADIPLGHIEVHDGRIEILSPVTEQVGPRQPTVPDPGGVGSLKRLTLERVSLAWDDAVLRLGVETPFSARLAAAAMDVLVLDEPLRITDGEGAFAIGPGGVRLDEARVSLPGSELTGALRIGPDEPGGPWRFSTELNAAPASLPDLRWLDPRLPEGTLTGRVEVVTRDGVDVTFHDVIADLTSSHLTLDGGFHFKRRFDLLGLEVTAAPLASAALDPWMSRSLPVDGWFSGRARFDGGVGALTTDARVTFVPGGFGGRPTTADVQGVLHFGDDPGATDFGGRLDPLDFELVEAFLPGRSMRGSGSADFTVSGRLTGGLRFTSQVTHAGDSLGASEISARGSVQRDGAGTWSVDAQADLAPLSLAVMNHFVPAVGLKGDVYGTARATGPLEDLHLTGDLEVGGGRVTLDAGFDAARMAGGYWLEAGIDGVDVAGVVAEVPAPAGWSGRLTLEGRGIRLDSLEGSASLSAFASRVGGLHVDTLHAALRAGGGDLRLDTLVGVVGGVTLGGSGTLGLVASRRGEVSFAFETDSLVRLRPLFMGDSIIARDELSNLQRDVLRFDGIDPDTLPLAADVAMSGAARGTMDVSGWVRGLDVALTASVQDGVFRRQALGRAEVRAEARGLPALASWALVADGTDVDLSRWTFDGAHVELGGEGRSGRGWFDVRRTADERYGASGGFALDSAGGRADLELATVRMDSVVWELSHPGRIAWSDSVLQVEDLEIARKGTDPGRVAAQGILSRTGASDFSLEVEGVHVDRLARLLQLDLEDVAGHVDFSTVVHGPAAEPLIDARIYAEDPHYGDLGADRVLSVLQYRDGRAAVNAEAWSGERSVFNATGSVPVDLGLVPRDSRVDPEGSIDARVHLDSIDASGLLAGVGALEDVEGFVSGDLIVRGTTAEPTPSGSIRLQKAAWSVPAIGVRHTDVTGLLTVNADRTVDVAVASRAGGVSDVTGSLDFETLTDPALDLSITFQRFLAVDRRDVSGSVSGSTALTGTYARPVLQGSLTVDEGTLFLEEFARSASVVDLTDPTLLGLDTLAFTARPLIAELRNPFLENLRAKVDLAVPRDTWLRSGEMNVEIGGDLIVTYDRSERDLVMVGDLQALRGSYSVLGRRFDVESGTVGFIGVPGINPTLDIQATSRIRQVDGERLDITADVTGTLIQPRVALGSQEQGLVEADLVSYLIFGRPTHELATGQQVALRGAVTGAASVLTGTVATAFGAAVAQGFGVDYLSISQAGDFTAAGGLQGSFAGTQVEIGQYVSEDVFVVLVLRPVPDRASNQGTNALGARVEWALSDNFTAEGFIEDRFLRNRSLGIGDLAALSNRVVGVFVFREWGY